MTQQNETNRLLSDAELEMVSGTGGRWIQGKAGWLWQYDNVKGSGNAGAFHVTRDAGTASVRTETVNGKTNVYKFDGKKEYLFKTL